MNKERKSDLEMRSKGLCPHDGGKCDRARRCTWNRAESCGVSNERLVHRCSPVACRKKFGACVWRCSAWMLRNNAQPR
jgi:hypothetical protein